jgi:hypothetical protein
VKLPARPAALSAALLVGALATYESAAALTAPARVAAEADWEAAADEVRAGFQPGDLIVFAPAWVDQIGRAHLGDRIPVEMAARADDDRYRRVWEVSIRGARAPDTEGLARVRASEHGRVAVALYEKSAVEPLYDFTAHATEARVTDAHPSGKDERPCFAEGPAGFRCAGVRVEPRTLEIDYQPRRGILAPALLGRVIAIEFPDVPLGAHLVGYTGLHDYISRLRVWQQVPGGRAADWPVDFRVLIDGKKQLEVRHLNSDGWRRFTVDTAPGRHTVRFEISAPDPSWRTFGFHAEARP